MAYSGKELLRKAKPLLSLNHEEARNRVLTLYKAWIRQCRFIGIDYDVPLTEVQLKAKVRQEFLKNKDVQDLRVIDMLVVKGQMELRETVNKWKTTTSFMLFFKDTWEPKPTKFLDKFMSGHD